jgi:hypothetical protein
VELNLAAMLDMAFQILTFFVLTFKPAPVEGQIAMRMPPPQLASDKRTGVAPGSTDGPADPLVNFNTLAIWLTSSGDGRLDKIDVGSITPGANQRQEIAIDPNLVALNSTLSGMLNDPASPFDQVVVQVGSHLRYDELMKVVGVCSRQTVGGGRERLAKLSLVDAGDVK